MEKSIAGPKTPFQTGFNPFQVLLDRKDNVHDPRRRASTFRRTPRAGRNFLFRARLNGDSTGGDAVIRSRVPYPSGASDFPLNLRSPCDVALSFEIFRPNLPSGRLPASPALTRTRSSLAVQTGRNLAQPGLVCPPPVRVPNPGSNGCLALETISIASTSLSGCLSPVGVIQRSICIPFAKSSASPA